MNRSAFLGITALGEGVTGLFLLLWPAVPLVFLLGVQTAEPETLLVARVAGTALLAIAVTSGMARNDRASPAPRAVLTGILLYDVAVAVVLAYAAIGLQLGGVLLWPAVFAHAALAIWGVRCISLAE